MVAAGLIGVGLPAIRAAAARHGFYALDLIADGLVEDGVGQEDQPLGAGVGAHALEAGVVRLEVVEAILCRRYAR